MKPMEEFIVELAHRTGAHAGFFGLTVSLVIAGFSLLFVNIITHAILEFMKERKANRILVQRNLKPVITAAGSLISRITEILVTQRRSTIEDIRRYDASKVHEHLANMTPLSMNRHESTAYRLILFLSEATAFQRQTAETPSFSFLNRIDYYLQHKIPVSLRGNLYGFTLMNTEVQEELASSLLKIEKRDNGHEFRIGQLCDSLKESLYKRDLFRVSLETFHLDVSPLADGPEIDHANMDWKKILALAHCAVYLIDFFQSLDDNPQWEEHRLLFVYLIKQWNVNATKRCYLYEIGDLETGNYIDTFPGRVGSRHFLFGLIAWTPEIWSIGRVLRRWVKFYLLNMRGRRFGNRHHLKRLRSWGVKIKVKEDWHILRWDGDLKTLHASVNSYLKTRLTN